MSRSPPMRAGTRDPALDGAEDRANGGLPVGSTVAYLMSRFPKLTETFVVNEIRALEREGVDVEIFPLLRERGEEERSDVAELVDRAHFQPFLSPAVLASNLRRFRRGPAKYLTVLREVLAGTWGSANFFFGALALFPKAVRFAELMEERGVEHIHAHFANHPTLVAYVIHDLTGIPYSFTAHGHDLHVERRMLCEKLDAAAFAVTVSEYNRELMVEECGERARDRVRVVHCGVDPDLFTPEEPGGAPGSTGHEGPLRIVCVASFEEVKGHRYLVEACRRLRDRGVDYECELVGEGPLRERTESRIRAYGLGGRVQVVGAVAPAEVARRLRRSDAAVLPSVRTDRGKREGIPVALMEAMASGLPVVASELSGIPELVEHQETGLLVPPGDPEALAGALARLAADGELCRRLGRAGRRKVRREFDLRENTRRLLQLLRREGGSPAASSASGGGG